MKELQLQFQLHRKITLPGEKRNRTTNKERLKKKIYIEDGQGDHNCNPSTWDQTLKRKSSPAPHHPGTESQTLTQENQTQGLLYLIF